VLQDLHKLAQETSTKLDGKLQQQLSAAQQQLFEEKQRRVDAEGEAQVRATCGGAAGAICSLEKVLEVVSLSMPVMFMLHYPAMPHVAPTCRSSAPRRSRCSGRWSGCSAAWQRGTLSSSSSRQLVPQTRLRARWVLVGGWHWCQCDGQQV